MNRFLLAAVATKSMILAPVSMLMHPSERVDRARAEGAVPDFFFDEHGPEIGGVVTTEERSWVLDTGFIGSGLNIQSFSCSGTRCWIVGGNTIKEDNNGNRVTANTLGFRGEAFDRCSSAEPWFRTMDTGWRYGFDVSIISGSRQGQYQNCGQMQDHFYRTRTGHYFQNSGTYSMAETHYINCRDTESGRFC